MVCVQAKMRTTPDGVPGLRQTQRQPALNGRAAVKNVCGNKKYDPEKNIQYSVTYVEAVAAAADTTTAPPANSPLSSPLRYRNVAWFWGNLNKKQSTWKYVFRKGAHRLWPSFKELAAALPSLEPLSGKVVPKWATSSQGEGYAPDQG